MHCKIEPSFCFHHHTFCCRMTILPMSYILEDLKRLFSADLSANDKDVLRRPCNICLERHQKRK